MLLPETGACGHQLTVQQEGGVQLSCFACNKICQGRVRNSLGRWQGIADTAKESGTDAEGLYVLINSVLLFVKADHPDVPETAVIGYPHEIKGEGM